MKICSIEDCEKEYLAKGFCTKHYLEARRKGLLLNQKICLVVGCGKPVWCKEFCQKHYWRLMNKGDPIARTIRDLNEYVDCETYSEIKLYNIKGGHIASAKIDSEDVEKCKQYKWYLSHYGYVQSDSVSSRIWLHKFVMDIDSSIEGDHIYGDKLDNRKSQLRECSHAQNIQNQKLHDNNTSGERGVCWNNRASKWMVYVEAFNKRHYFGDFQDFEDACQVARSERQRLHKEFVRDK